MDVGLYSLSVNQGGIAGSNLTPLSFDNTLRACEGVSLGAGGIFEYTREEEAFLLANFDYTRTGGGVNNEAWTQWCSNPSVFADRGALSTGPVVWSPGLGHSSVGGAACPFNGPNTLHLAKADSPIEFAACSNVSNSSNTCNSLYTWACIMRLDMPLLDIGIYSLLADQLGLNAVGQLIAWDNPLKACQGVSLAGSVFTVSEDGLYVFVGTPGISRTAGAGVVMASQWTTDPLTGGVTPYPVAVASKNLICDATVEAGSNAGAIALVERVGADVSIGMNVQAITAATTFTVTAGVSSVVVMRLL